MVHAVLGRLCSSSQKHKALASTKQQHSVNMELLRRARQHVEAAIKEKILVQGSYPIIHKLLWARDWVK